jgi:hypothetical protein
MADQSTAVKHTGEDKAAIKADPANVRAADSAGSAADLAMSSGSGAGVRASGKLVPVRVATKAIAPFVGPGSGPFEVRSGAFAMARCYGLVAEGRHRCARPMPLTSARTRARARPNPASPLGSGFVSTLADFSRRVPRDLVVVFPFFLINLI